MASRTGIVVGAVALAVAAGGIYTRLNARAALKARADESAAPLVSVITPQAAPASQDLVLPGTVEAWVDAPVYARANGYLRRWHADLGVRVKKGQLLAEIDAPEVDSQLRQAEADEAQARANDAIARGTAERYRQLVASGAVSQQAADEKAADAEAKKALLEAAQANLQRLRDTQGFSRILAPFDGTITARRTDVGQLVTAGSGTELFHLADDRRLRVFVQVPQAYAPSVQPGLAAELRFAERPGQPVAAAVARTADSLDAASRSLRTELDVDNSKGELLPGSYAEVRFKLPGPVGTVRVPSNALIFRAEGPQVALLPDGKHVKLAAVSVGRDFGTEVELLSGVGPGDTLVMNPPDSIGEGVEVRVVKPAATGAPPAAAPAAPAAGTSK